MTPGILSPAQVEEFVERGYTLVRDAFSAETARQARAALWKRLALSPDDPAGWTRPMMHIRESYAEGPFGAIWTERLLSAIADLAGAGRFKRPTSVGWWPVAFPGFDKPPWTPPDSGWHIDGIQFHHHVDSADQGLLPILIFSEIEPGGGGTAVSVGSHKITARILAEAEPDGLVVGELTRRVNAHPRQTVAEVTGMPGEAALLHPFMLHARSPNTGSRVRFICNPCIRLKEKMNLARDDPDDYSPVERAIAQALG